jgi:hypothetical protein
MLRGNMSIYSGESVNRCMFFTRWSLLDLVNVDFLFSGMNRPFFNHLISTY